MTVSKPPARQSPIPPQFHYSQPTQGSEPQHPIGGNPKNQGQIGQTGFRANSGHSPGPFSQQHDSQFNMLQGNNHTFNIKRGGQSGGRGGIPGSSYNHGNRNFNNNNSHSFGNNGFIRPRSKSAGSDFREPRNYGNQNFGIGNNDFHGNGNQSFHGQGNQNFHGQGNRVFKNQGSQGFQAKNFQNVQEQRFGNSDHYGNQNFHSFGNQGFQNQGHSKFQGYGFQDSHARGFQRGFPRSRRRGNGRKFSQQIQVDNQILDIKLSDLYRQGDCYSGGKQHLPNKCPELVGKGSKNFH